MKFIRMSALFMFGFLLKTIELNFTLRKITDELLSLRDNFLYTVIEMLIYTIFVDHLDIRTAASRLMAHKMSIRNSQRRPFSGARLSLHYLVLWP